MYLVKFPQNSHAWSFFLFFLFFFFPFLSFQVLISLTNMRVWGALWKENCLRLQKIQGYLLNVDLKITPIWIDSGVSETTCFGSSHPLCTCLLTVTLSLWMQSQTYSLLWILTTLILGHTVVWKKRDFQINRRAYGLWPEMIWLLDLEDSDLGTVGLLPLKIFMIMSHWWFAIKYSSALFFSRF